MFRRVAIAASDRADPTSYCDLPARLQHNSYELAAFEHHAEALSCVATFEDLTDLNIVAWVGSQEDPRDATRGRQS
jgi:hypothetical protein